MTDVYIYIRIMYIIYRFIYIYPEELFDTKRIFLQTLKFKYEIMDMEDLEIGTVLSSVSTMPAIQ